MKLPSSSSLILATLAVSSSSTSLAAPTSDHANGDLGRSDGNRVKGNTDEVHRSFMRALGVQARDDPSTVSASYSSAFSEAATPSPTPDTQSASSTGTATPNTRDAPELPIPLPALPPIPALPIPLPALPALPVPVPALPLPLPGGSESRAGTEAPPNSPSA